MQQVHEPLRPKRVLGIAAHPDDLDFGAAGAVARFAAEGATVQYLLLTNGNKGSEDRSITPERLTELRREEQQAAARALGFTEVLILDNPDGYLEVSMQLKRDIVRVIRQFRPDTVIGWDPTVAYVSERNFINHPDHRAAGQAMLDALFPLARDHMSFPELLREGLEPHKVEHVLLMNLATANYYVDITGTLDAKLRALRCHASQLKDAEAAQRRLTEQAEQQGAVAGCKYAEGFVRLTMPA